MSLTQTERQRRYRARLKKKEAQASNSVESVYRQPFHTFYGHQGFDLDFELALALAGVAAPEFLDDSGPEAFVLNDATAGVADPFNGATGALGRAEVMIGCLTDAAVALASLVNEYKRQEIKARLAEIEASDLSEPEAKKAALQDSARLNKMLDQLDKQVRWTFPQWKVTG